MRDIRQLIAEMTLEEKARLLVGRDDWHTQEIPRLDIPAVMVSDGPHGLRKQEGKTDNLGIYDSIPAVCFPAACATASSFDRELVREMGRIIGNECQAEDVSIVLGPAVNIKRSPLCGRNFEYFSEDPHAAGQIAAAYIEGVQSKNIGTSIKHFAANNQEYNRMSNSSEISERTLRELYFPAFETAVKEAKPWTVMCSYNRINGTYASQNEWLLTKVLREDWGFDGYVMTDWGAVDDRVAGLQAGCDLEMPGPDENTVQRLIEAVQSGVLSEECLDRSLERILTAMDRYLRGRDENAVFDRAKDHEAAVRIETESAVLLQNNGVLPLTEGQKVAYIGEFAASPRYQGGGSSHINAFRVDSALETAQAKGRKVEYVKGFPGDRDEFDEEECRRAVEAAGTADAAVIFAGLPDLMESEGYDRSNMKLPECQNRLIREVAKVQPNTVVVLHNGSPVECPWAEDVAAVLELYLGGEGVGRAADLLLFGEVNPSGHLAETFPYRLEDTPSYLNFPGEVDRVVYAEGVFVGYRYYDTKKMPVRWAFGHGLSYTDFAYSSLRVSDMQMNDQSVLEISVDVANTGEREGKEVVQLYVSDKNGTPLRPEKELKGFEKISLKPGETKTVTMQITPRDLSYYEEKLGDWYAPSGTYLLQVGGASDAIALSEEITFETQKRIPIHVSGCTMLSELFQNPDTEPYANRIRHIIAKKRPSFEEELDPVRDAMRMAMPLKQLESMGILKRSELEELYREINEMQNT